MGFKTEHTSLQAKFEELEKRLVQSDDTVRRLLLQLDEKFEELALLNGLMRAMGANKGIREVLQLFATNLKRLCPFDRLSIALYDEATAKFQVPFVARQGQVMQNEEDPLPFDDQVLREVIQAKRPLLRDNIKDTKIHFKTDTGYIRRGYACELLFPLEGGGMVYGTFNIGCYEPGKLDERHKRMLSELIACVSLAVHQYIKSRGDKPISGVFQAVQLPPAPKKPQA